jgi:hypothetical protein
MSGIQELIRERAHELWQWAGGPDDRSDEFRFAAEHELEGETATVDGEGTLIPSVDEPPADAFFLEGPVEGPVEGPANIPSTIIQ